MLGLDSASATLVARWTACGALPHLRAIQDSGVRGVLVSPPGLGDDATWASFYTCTTPGAHGRYYFRSIQPASYEFPYVREEHVKRSPFWKALSRAGCRVAVIDVPKCPLSPEINGLHLTDWRVHGRDQETRSIPRELASEVQARFGPDRTDRPGTEDWRCRMDVLGEAELRVFLDHLLTSIEDKTRLAEELLAREKWDLFLLVYKEAHCAGHQLWHLVDPAHPAYSPELAERLDNPLLRVYQALDRAIGRLRAQLSADSKLLVFSDLDMGPNYTGEHILDEVLLLLERALRPSRPLHSRWLEGFMKLKRQVKGLVTGRYRPLTTHAFRHAFQLEHNEISGTIRINVRGREPMGLVQPGADYDDFCSKLSHELLQLTNPETGESLVDEVLRVDQLYQGENRDLLPDLLVLWNRNAPIQSAHSPLMGSIRPRPSGLRTGNHLHNGFCLATGPTLGGASEFKAAITDLGPTVSQWLGVNLPDVDGRPIPELAEL